MTRALWDHLLEQARAAHQASAALTNFCPFPDDVTAQPVSPYHIPAADLMTADHPLPSSGLSALRDAFVAAGSSAHWRETYKGTDIGQDFLDRFACYSLIGPGAPWTSSSMYAFVVYMPPGLWYPWHQHP